MLIAHFTDTHAVAEGALAVRGRVDTNRGLEAAVAFINGLEPRPDLVLHTGDVTDTGTTAEFAAAARRLGQLGVPLVAIPGNHDQRDPMRAALVPLGAVPTEGGFLHQVRALGPLTLIALDTLVPGHPHGTLCAERLAWVEAALDGATARPVLLVMHHPPFLTGIGTMDAINCRGVERLERAVRRHGQVVRLLVGHLHRQLTTQWAGVPALALPGTAHQVALDLVPNQPPYWTLEPPAIAVHHWTGDGLVSHQLAIGAYPRRPFAAD